MHPQTINLQPINTQPTRRLTQKELDGFLETAADILRGNADHSEFRGYVFALLFYKRLSDVYSEEVAKLVVKLGDETLATDPRMHDFVVPEDVHWDRVVGSKDAKNVATTARDIGTKLNEAMIRIERANQPKLDGLLTSKIDFNAQDALPREKLMSLLNHFRSQTFDLASVSEDLFGDAYEYLIRSFASKAGKSSGEYYTPPEVAYLMAQVIEPREGQSVCDWACGSGGLLLQCVRYLSEHGSNPKRLFLHGQESNTTTFNIARLNLLLHGVGHANLRRQDSLRYPQHLDEQTGELKRFDRVVMNPPFSLEDWGAEKVTPKDPYKRISITPPASNGDYAWMQHIAASLKHDGKAMVVMSQGILFRGQPEQTEEEDGQNRKADDEYLIRRKFVEDDLIEMVVVLPSKLFYGNSVPGCLVLLNKAKPAERSGKVLMVYASRHFESANPQNLLRTADLMRILLPWRGYGDLEQLPTLIDQHEADYIAKTEKERKRQLTDIADAYDPVIGQLEHVRAELAYLGTEDYKGWEASGDPEHHFFAPLSTLIKAVEAKKEEVEDLPEDEKKAVKEELKGLKQELQEALKVTKKAHKDRVKLLKDAVKKLEKLELKRDFLTSEVNAQADREVSELREAAADLRCIVADSEEAARYFAVVDKAEVEENEYNLNMPRYVDTFEPEEEIRLEDAIEAVTEAKKEVEVANERLQQILSNVRLNEKELASEVV